MVVTSAQARQWVAQEGSHSPMAPWLLATWMATASASQVPLKHTKVVSVDPLACEASSCCANFVQALFIGTLGFVGIEPLLNFHAMKLDPRQRMFLGTFLSCSSGGVSGGGGTGGGCCLVAIVTTLFARRALQPRQ